MMNYRCDPDIAPNVDLTPDTVALFQRFRQKSDLATVDGAFEKEVTEHIKLCELAILHAASITFYWCEFPRHPIQEVELVACRHLSDVGFKIEHHKEATEEKVSLRDNRDKTVTALVVKSHWTISWLTMPAKREATSAEWRRRERLEDSDRHKNPPQRQSYGFGTALKSGKAIWATSLPGKFVAEVQRINQRNFLCIFDPRSACFHIEETTVSFGAIFGPDISDVAAWTSRAHQYVKSRQRRSRH